LQCLFYVLEAESLAWLSQRKVPLDGIIEQDAMLLNERDIISKPLDVYLVDGKAVKQDLSRRGLIEPNKKLTQGTLAGTTFSENKSGLSRRKEQRYVANRDFL
jgi:hypothetical protein